MRRTWVVGLVCLLIGALVAGGIVFAFQDRQLTPEEELVRELEKFAVNGEEITGKVIFPPEAMKIDYRVDQETLKWMGRFELDVRISNVGEKEILYFELVSFLVDKDGNLHPEDEETVQRFANVAAMTLEEYRRFSPIMALPVPPLGKSIPVTVSFGKLGDLWEPAHGFVIEIRNLHFDGEPMGEPAPEEPIVEPGLSPGQALKAFTKALREGRYTEAGKYISRHILEEIKRQKPEFQDFSPAEIAERMANAWREANRMVVRIEILEETIREDHADVRVVLYFSDGTKKETTSDMIKEEGIWKIF